MLFSILYVTFLSEFLLLTDALSRVLAYLRIIETTLTIVFIGKENNVIPFSVEKWLAYIDVHEKTNTHNKIIVADRKWRRFFLNTLIMC